VFTLETRVSLGQGVCVCDRYLMRLHASYHWVRRGQSCMNLLIVHERRLTVSKLQGSGPRPRRASSGLCSSLNAGGFGCAVLMRSYSKKRGTAQDAVVALVGCVCAGHESTDLERELPTGYSMASWLQLM
jgi:hypothetical protein